jgi:hypothetical protein
MPIDFDNYVLRPNQAFFSQMATWFPNQSRPGKNSYRGRGILRVYSKFFQTAEGGLVTTTTIDFDIRTSEYTNPIPIIQDQLTIDRFPGYPNNTRFWIENAYADGFGCVKYQLGLVTDDVQTSPIGTGAATETGDNMFIRGSVV